MSSSEREQERERENIPESTASRPKPINMPKGVVILYTRTTSSEKTRAGNGASKRSEYGDEIENKTDIGVDRPIFQKEAIPVAFFSTEEPSAKASIHLWEMMATNTAVAS
jgi:hypothetical protein